MDEDSRKSPIEMTKKEFREIGYQLINDISDFLDTIDKKPVTKAKSPAPASTSMVTFILTSVATLSGSMATRFSPVVSLSIPIVIQ